MFEWLRQGLDNRGPEVQFPTGQEIVCLLQPNCSYHLEAHSTCYWVGTGGCLPKGGVKMNTHLHLPQRLGLSGVINSVPHTPAWPTQCLVYLLLMAFFFFSTFYLLLFFTAVHSSVDQLRITRWPASVPGRVKNAETPPNTENTQSLTTDFSCSRFERRTPTHLTLQYKAGASERYKLTFTLNIKVRLRQLRSPDRYISINAARHFRKRSLPCWRRTIIVHGRPEMDEGLVRMCMEIDARPYNSSAAAARANCQRLGRSSRLVPSHFLLPVLPNNTAK